jgi:hypothetical protein
MEVSLELSFGILGDEKAGKDAAATKQKCPDWSRGALLYGGNVQEP